MLQRLSIVMSILVLVILASCRSNATEANSTEMEDQQPTSNEAASLSRNDPKGRLLLWHYWQGKELLVLNDFIEQFESIYEGVDIIAVPESLDQIRTAFPKEAQLGFGPDMILAPNNLAGVFSEKNLLLDIDKLNLHPEFAASLFDPSVFGPAALGSLTYQDKLYGLPITMDTYALYYNTDLVSKPARNLEDVLIHAKRGNPAAFHMSFFAGAWGISAFGGKIRNREGQIILNQGGFKSWLRWLLQAQNTPGMLLSSDKETLYEHFISGKAAYFTGNSRNLLRLERDMPNGNFAVTRLPRGPDGIAHPYLETEALLFNRAIGEEQRELAVAFANFLMVAEQQRTLMRKLIRLPANGSVRIDPSLSSLEGFSRQVQSALPFKSDPVTRELVFGEGNDIFDQVLGGVLTPNEATARLSSLNTLFNMEVPATAEEEAYDVCARLAMGC